MSDGNLQGADRRSVRRVQLDTQMTAAKQAAAAIAQHKAEQALKAGKTIAKGTGKAVVATGEGAVKLAKGSSKLAKKALQRLQEEANTLRNDATRNGDRSALNDMREWNNGSNSTQGQEGP